MSSIHPSIHGWGKTRPTATNKTAWRGPITFGRHVSALEHPRRKWALNQTPSTTTPSPSPVHRPRCRTCESGRAAC